MCGFLKIFIYLYNITRTNVDYIGCTHTWDFKGVQTVKCDTFYGFRSIIVQVGGWPYK